MTEPTRAVSVDDRERAIFAYLKDPGRPAGATVYEIWEAVSKRLGDTVTRQAYYKLLGRMAATGRLDVAEDPAAQGGRRYSVAAYLHADNAITLDDVYELLDQIEPSDAIARAIDARDYFDERRGNALAQAAEALLDEDPRELVAAYLLHQVAALRADLVLLASDELRDRALEGRVAVQLKDLHLMAYRYLGLSRAALDAPPEAASARPGAERAEITVNEDRLRAEIARRVFGATAIRLIDTDAEPTDDPQAWNRITVAGSDGSTHASVLQIATAAPYTDDFGSEVVTFNNSVVFVQAAPARPKDVDRNLYYSVPINRAAIDDPSNRGMVLAPFMFRYLSESEYEHMAKCATDVVQWRADEAVFLGTARALGDGNLLPRPSVHFRDGTITPQEREYGHYRRWNEYGEMVREGIARSRTILDRIMSAPAPPPVFAGAVKSTQAKLFSTLLNWYIAHGSRRRFGRPIDPHWDTTRAAHIADNEAMSFLLSTLNARRPPGGYYVTFAVMRPFHSLTEWYRQPLDDDPRSWLGFFERKRDREQRIYDSGDVSEMPYLATVPDLADENFVHMCVNADYVSFYIGHTSGDPPPTAPRYEFLESLRRMAPLDAADRVDRNVNMIVAAIEKTKLSADLDHNFLSRKTLAKLVPFVIFEAHEKCKALGRGLEAEMRSIVIANLQGLRRARDLQPGDVRFLPLSIRRFVERYAQATQDNDGDNRRNR
jgi:hypothetical protein